MKFLGESLYLSLVLTFMCGHFMMASAEMMEDSFDEEPKTNLRRYAKKDKKVTLCHIRHGNHKKFRTIKVGKKAAEKHLKHGDLEGPCSDHCETLCDDGNICTLNLCADNGKKCFNPPDESTCPPLSCPPGAYWPFQHGVQDKVGGFDGTLTNELIRVPGKVGKAYQFDTWIGSYIIVGKNQASEDISTLYSDGEFTIVMWVKRETPSEAPPNGWQVLFADWDGNMAIHFNLFDGRMELYTTTSRTEARGNSVLDLDTWYHLGVSVKDGVATFYKNGMEDGKGPTGTSIPSSPDAVKSIGAKGKGSYSFDGILDEVAMYGCALSTDEVKQLYDTSAAGHSYPTN